MEHKSYKLPVPTNVSLRAELIPGIATRDLLKAFLYCLIASVSLFALNKLGVVKVLVALLIAIIVPVAYGFYTQRVTGNLSMKDNVAITARYGKSQKMYHYNYRSGGK